MILGAWKKIICKCRIGSDKDIILETNPAPDLDPALYGDTISKSRVAFNEDPVANIAVFANDSARKNMGKGPDFCASSDLV